jgi:hypothetical protein
MFCWHDWRSAINQRNPAVCNFDTQFVPSHNYAGVRTVCLHIYTGVAVRIILLQMRWVASVIASRTGIMNKIHAYTGFGCDTEKFHPYNKQSVINRARHSESKECVIRLAIVECAVSPFSKEHIVLSLFSYRNTTTNGVAKVTTNTDQYTTQTWKFNSVHMRILASSVSTGSGHHH